MEFDIPDKNKRKFQCFVCGVQFTEYVEYKEHIIEEHEEGKEYVVCPLKRCGAPVREMRLHFKVKHPSEKLPKSAATRALIWKDVSPTKGKKGEAVMKTRKPKFRKGIYESVKMGRNFEYRSGYEAKVYELLDEWVEIQAFSAEPFKIPYVFEGKSHTYTPDILVNFVNGRVELWEIKPENQTALPVNKAKWTSARLHCETRGWTFKVITEQGIEQLKKKVSQQDIKFS